MSGKSFLYVFAIVIINFVSKNLETVPVVVVHGGAGAIPLNRLYGGSAVDAVEAAVRYMESDEYFNAGYGSVLNTAGYVEMDASIMDGTNLSAGAVAAVQDIAHPISLARLVMEKTPHVMLVAHGAQLFASQQGVDILPPGSLITEYSKKSLEEYKRKGGKNMNTDEYPGDKGTVGAVALDRNGFLAAATSTGGLTGKMVGRVGDSPQIGSGTYANNIAAVSCTGHGESIIKVGLARSIMDGISRGRCPQSSTQSSIEYIAHYLNNTAGAIVVSRTGKIGIHFTTKQMPFAAIKGNIMVYGLERGQKRIKSLSGQ